MNSVQVMTHRIVNWGAAQACEDSEEQGSSLEEAAGKDGSMVPNYLCVMGFLHGISITDNEELKHNSLMHEKKGLHRAGYSQAMIILMKLTLIQEAQEEA